MALFEKRALIQTVTAVSGKAVSEIGDKRFKGGLMIVEPKDAVETEPAIINISRMANDIFKADSEWLKRMCTEEVAQREANESRSSQI